MAARKPVPTPRPKIIARRCYCGRGLDKDKRTCRAHGWQTEVLLTVRYPDDKLPAKKARSR